MQLLAPVAPHICHVLWEHLGHTNSILETPWPVVDQAALVKSQIDIVAQVNGKVRAKLSVAADTSKEALEELALANDNVQKFTADKQVRKVIVVPGKLINIVVG